MTYTDKHEPSGQLAPSLLPRELHVERVSCSWGTCNSNPRVELNHSPLNQHRRRTSSLFLIGAFVFCRIHRLAIFIRLRSCKAAFPPPSSAACCSLHRCYRMFTDVASLCFGTTRCSFCFSLTATSKPEEGGGGQRPSAPLSLIHI